MERVERNSVDSLYQELESLHSTIENFLATTLTRKTSAANPGEGDACRPEDALDNNHSLKQITGKLVEVLNLFLHHENSHVRQLDPIPVQIPSVLPCQDIDPRNENKVLRILPVKCSESMDTFTVEPPTNHAPSTPIKLVAQTRNSPTFIVAERRKLRQTAANPGKLPAIRAKLPLVAAKETKPKPDERFEQAQARIKVLEDEIENLQRQELLLLAYPDPYGPCKIRPTGDPRRDMQMQIAANHLRRQLLEKQTGHLSRILSQNDGMVEGATMYRKNASEEEAPWLPSMLSHCPCSMSYSKLGECQSTKNSTSFHVEWKSRADSVRAKASKSQGKCDSQSKLKPLKSDKISPESVTTCRTNSSKRTTTKGSIPKK